MFSAWVRLLANWLLLSVWEYVIIHASGSSIRHSQTGSCCYAIGLLTVNKACLLFSQQSLLLRSTTWASFRLRLNVVLKCLPVVGMKIKTRRVCALLSLFTCFCFSSVKMNGQSEWSFFMDKLCGIRKAADRSRTNISCAGNVTETIATDAHWWPDISWWMTRLGVSWPLLPVLSLWKSSMKKNGSIQETPSAKTEVNGSLSAHEKEINKTNGCI